MNFRALLLVVLFLAPQLFAMVAAADSQQPTDNFHFTSNTSNKQKGHSTKDTYAFEIEEEEESELEFLKKSFSEAKTNRLFTNANYLIVKSETLRYFTQCVSGFRHVRNFIYIRSIRI